MSKEYLSNQLDQLMQLATREDLVSFLLEYADSNASFKRDLQAYLGKKYLVNKKTTDDYVKMMAAAFQQTKDIGNRWHSFEVTDWESVFFDALKVIRSGEKMLELGNADAAATIAVEFFRMFSKEFDVNTFFDDEDNDCDGAYECEAAEKLLLNAIDHPYISSKTQERLIAELKEISRTNFAYELDNYGIYDFDAMLMKVSKKVMTDDDTLSLLDSQIVQHKGQYDEHTYVERKIELLRQMGRDNDADETEKNNLHMSEIRRKAVQRYTEIADYDKAIAYAEEGVRIASSSNGYCHPDTWREILLEVYEKNGNKEKQIEVSRILFINTRGQSEHYHKLKQLIEPTVWREYLDALLAEAKLSTKATWGRCNLADIYAEEGYKEKLFQIIMDNSKYDTDILNNYSKYVGEEKAAELLNRYAEILRKDADGSANVKVYHRIADAMEHMIELKGGKAAAHELAEFFRQQYKRRPSMMQEIRKF